VHVGCSYFKGFLIPDAENRVVTKLVLNLQRIKRGTRKEFAMLYYALVFLVVALIAGVLGFCWVAFASTEIAKICFFVFLVLFVVSLISHLSRRGAA